MLNHPGNMAFGDVMKKENMIIDCVVGEFPHFQVPTSIRLGVGKTWDVCKNLFMFITYPKDNSPGKFSWLTKVDLRVHPNPWHCAPLQMFGPPQGACMHG